MTIDIVENVEKGKNPHLALCHELNPSANKRPVSLLMKASIKLTPELLNSLGLSDSYEIKKSVSTSELNKSLVSELIKNNLSK